MRKWACARRSARGIDIDLKERIDRKFLRFMGEGAAYGHIAMEQAIADAGLENSEISSERIGIVMGSGGGSPKDQLESFDVMRERGIRRVGPYRVPPHHEQFGIRLSRHRLRPSRA